MKKKKIIKIIIIIIIIIKNVIRKRIAKILHKLAKAKNHKRAESKKWKYETRRGKAKEQYSRVFSIGLCNSGSHVRLRGGRRRRGRPPARPRAGRGPGPH